MKTIVRADVLNDRQKTELFSLLAACAPDPARPPAFPVEEASPFFFLYSEDGPQPGNAICSFPLRTKTKPAAWPWRPPARRSPAPNTAWNGRLTPRFPAFYARRGCSLTGRKLQRPASSLFPAAPSCAQIPGGKPPSAKSTSRTRAAAKPIFPARAAAKPIFPARAAAFTAFRSPRRCAARKSEKKRFFLPWKRCAAGASPPSSSM